jgi:hypothetical protein
MEQETINLYNPANAKNLTAEQLAAMSNFSDEDIKQLATAYPNKATGNAYLVIGNTKLKQQIGARSTFANLYNLRVANQQKNFYPLSYTAIWKRPATKQTVASMADLTKQEIEALPGIKGFAKKTVSEVIAPAAKGKGKGKDKAPEQKAKQVNKAEQKSLTLPDANANDENDFPDLTDEANKAGL